MFKNYVLGVHTRSKCAPINDSLQRAELKPFLYIDILIITALLYSHHLNYVASRLRILTSILFCTQCLKLFLPLLIEQYSALQLSNIILYIILYIIL